MQFFFANCKVDVVRRELNRGAETVALQPQVFDLLVYLLKNRDRVTSKDDLVAGVWGGRIVSDSTLHSRINAVRKAIGDNGRQQKFIRTMARKGIRFVGEVTEASADPAGATSPSIDDRPIFAVLPFHNLSDDPSHEYFADGLSEDLIAALGSWCRFPVICRHSSFIFKGRSINAVEAGRQLGARYILEGSVRKSTNQVRITASLTDATTGLHLWADRYDREIDDVFAVQDEITARIAAAVEPELHRHEQRRAAVNPKINAAAYDLVQRGNWHHNRFTAIDAGEAQRLFAAAIEADPKYARAYSSMASTKFWAAQMGWAKDPQAALETALEFARKATALDDEDARGHFHVAQASLWLRRHDEAIAEARRAIALNPSLVQAHAVLGYALDCIGEFQEAISTVTSSLRLRPYDQTIVRCIPALSIAHYQLGAFDAAEEVAQRVVGMNKNYWMGHQMLAASLGQLGRKPEAAAALAEILRREPKVSRAAYSGRFP
ncbi:MAG TPA: winged helix-turn-helix domain-containing tetratricopeptide repeat protein, partial [Hyphomonadaceae bacterium]